MVGLFYDAGKGPADQILRLEFHARSASRLSDLKIDRGPGMLGKIEGMTGTDRRARGS